MSVFGCSGHLHRVLVLAILGLPNLAAAQIKVSILPQSAAVFVGNAQQFTATVTGTTNTVVNWFVDGIPGGNTTTGIISSAGLYTAPIVTGSHTVQATSAASISSSGISTTIVFSRLTADFAGRSNTTRLISPGLIAAQRGDLLDSTGLSLLKQAGYGELRTDAKLQDVFANISTPNWNAIDPTILTLKNQGFKVLLMMGYSPLWLAMTPNPCASNVAAYHAAPKDVNAWAKLAAVVVAHMDSTFPGVVTDYEIWNEPDVGPGMCVPSTVDRLQLYLSMFSAAASAMHNQAAADCAATPRNCTRIRIGGPAVVSPSNAAYIWVPALLSSTAAPNVDFISYHNYVTSTNSPSLTWDGAGSALSFSEQGSKAGFAAQFTRVSAAVRSGTQPNPLSTPIFVTEYNDTYYFNNNCCRNSANYAPLFNAMAVADFLNTVYLGAQNPPGMLFYFSASTPSGAFCLVGSPANLDCSTAGGFQGYPQYYAYKMLASPNYLNLAAGGYVTTALAPSMRQAGLVLSGFYTAASDAIFVVNPSSTNYPSVPVLARNPGQIASQGSVYLLDSSTPQISVTPVTLTPVWNGATFNVAIPPYSVVAISMPTLP